MTEPPDLTTRFERVRQRLEDAMIGSFTAAELEFVRAALQIEGPLRIHHSFEGIVGDRDPDGERAYVERLEQLAAKAGV